MSFDIFTQVIDGSWIIPDTNCPIGKIIQKVEIGNVRGNIKQLLQEIGFDKQNITIVCDENTYQALGKYIEIITHNNVIILPGNVKPELGIINKLSLDTKNSSALIAVGSGTINDICKYASFLNNIKYAVFATAPSMNGYASISASIIENGFRTSKRAHYPVGIFMDVEVMASVSMRLIRAGVGDMLCRSTAQVDWLLSHMLLDTKYMQAPFVMLESYEKELIYNIDDLLKLDHGAIANLAKMLVLSGIGMTICEGSYPASQGEHMIAHAIEMVYGDGLEPLYHGEQIAVTTVTMAKIQEYFLNSSWNGIFSRRIDKSEKQIKDFFGTDIGASCLENYNKKKILLSKIDHRIKNLEGEVKIKLLRLISSSQELVKTFEHIGLQVNNEALGLSQNQYEVIVEFAKYSRDRFTFLDLVDGSIVKLLEL